MAKRETWGKLTAFLCTLAIMLAGVGAFTLATVASPSVAMAQDDDDDVAGDDDDDVVEEEAPADDGGDSDDDEEKSLLGWFFGALGWMYTPIFLALSFTLVALLVMNLLTARRDNVCPVHLVEGFEEHLNEKRYQEAFELAKNDDSFLGQVLAAGLAKLSSGYAEAIEAMQEVGEEESMKLEHRLSYIALIGTVSPMIGLFGTVHGMILTFMTISRSSGAPPKPSALADDISTALVTTLVGLALAIPAIAAYSILRNRISRLVLEVGILSEGLMSRFQNVGKK